MYCSIEINGIFFCSVSGRPEEQFALHGNERKEEVRTEEVGERGSEGQRKERRRWERGIERMRK